MIRSQAHQLDDAIDRLLIVSDIHAHLPPLRAFDRLRAKLRGRSQVVFNGDLFFGGGRPAEAAEWVIENAGALGTIGNHDEGMLLGGERDDPAYTEAGAYRRLTAAQRDHFARLPHRLELTWRGRRIVLMHGHRTPDGQFGSWMATPERQIGDFLDPTADLCCTGHTHFPFRRREGSTLFANSGSMSLTILAVREAEGLHVQSGEDAVPPDADARPSFLSVTEGEAGLQVDVVRFEYDREAALADLEAAGFPDVEPIRRWMADGILGE
jgi:predicted phosphodiesterase